MNIPEEAVEAVARANWEHAFHSEWGKQPAVIQDAYRDAARRQVQAAAPFIAAQAWDEGYKWGRSDESLGAHRPRRTPNPHRSTQ